ncbi:MAG: lipid-A-disaccharide synthase N-terminal domain-containing protein [Flavobacteriaceae bacterium]|nr:lipid-A-disaccharide synthase N-terminal domain-containing protein [Flavobacteriaceae bacterium]
MSNWIIYSIGFIAQLLFSVRVLIQWVISERDKKVITPSLFWKFSLMGSVLMFVYGYLRTDFAIMLGQSIGYFVYIRNLHFQNEWQKLPKFLRILLLIFPVLIVIYYHNNNQFDIYELFHPEKIATWLLIWGTLAQIIFAFRFVYQWLYSEKKRESVLPYGFWILSLTGALMILVYAVFREDPVLFLGNIFTIFIYIRNLILLKKEV